MLDNSSSSKLFSLEVKYDELVNHSLSLGMIVTNDLKWNKHVSNIPCMEKASERLYLLKQLKRAEVETSSLYKFYNACIRYIVEYA